MDNKDTIHIAFCIDKNYPLQVMLVINSILKNNTSKSKYKFYIIENNLSKLDKFHITMFAKLKGQDVKIIHTDTTIIDNGKNVFERSSVSMTKYITRIGIARILLPKLLPKLKRVLYLDVDLVVLGDLKSLWNMNLENHMAGMSCHYAVSEDRKYVIKTRDYFNSGVILMDLEKWRENNISEKMINLLQKKVYKVPDQDVIKEVLGENIKEISFLWNFTNYLFWAKDVIKVPQNVKILHYYYGKAKPWNSLFCKDEDILCYLKYWNKSYLKIFKLKYILPSFKNLIKEINNRNESGMVFYKKR